MNKTDNQRRDPAGQEDQAGPAGSTRESSLQAFVARGRELATRNGLDFGSDAWEVSRLLVPRRGHRACGPRFTLRFTSPPDGHGGTGAWPRCVADVAKAVCAGLLGHASVTPMIVRRDVFRSLARTMGPRPLTECTVADLDAAAADLHARYAVASARMRVARLRSVAISMERAGLVRPGLADWRPERLGRGGAAQDTPPRGTALRQPADGLSEAIARGFARAVRPRDVLATSACTIMQFVPTRITAVLDLEEGCLSECLEGGVRRLLIRLPVGNGLEPRARWVPREMTEVAEIAFRRIHDVTAEARAIKHSYDERPDRIHLPPRLEHLRRRNWLTVEEVSSLLGLIPSGVPAYARRHGLALRLRGRAALVSFSDVETLVLGRLPEAMELSGGRARHPLMLLKLRIKNAPLPSECMFQPFRTAACLNALMPPGPRQVGVLARLGADPSGTLKVDTDGWRRALALAAVRGGLGRDDLLDWFGHSGLGGTCGFERDLDTVFRGAMPARSAFRRLAGPGGGRRRMDGGEP